MAKTRAQLNTGANKNMFRLLADMARAEGAGSLYRGLLSPILAEAPKRATKFATNEQFKTFFRREDGSLPFYRAGAAGGLAGAIEALINCPFETVKVRVSGKNVSLIESGE